MEDIVIRYLYGPNLAIDLVLLATILLSLTRVERLTSIMVVVMLLRPNERFNSFVPYTVVVSILIIALLLFRRDKNMVAKQLSYSIPLILYLLIIVFQTALFDRKQLFDIVWFIAPSLLLYLAIIFYCSVPKCARWLSYAIVISCFLICFEPVFYHYMEPIGSVVYNLFHHSLPGHEGQGRIQAWGNWSNANETAFLACIGIINTIFLCVRFKQKFFLAITSVLIPFFTLVIYLTASRAGIATVVIFFLVLGTLMNLKKGKIMMLMLVGAIVFFSATFTPERRDSEGSSAERADLRYGGIQMFKAYPLFGVGFRKSIYDLGGQPIHNTYIQAFAETGLIGGVFLFYYLYKAGLSLCQALRSHKMKQLSTTNLAIVSGLFLSSLFYFFWGNQLLTIMFFLVMGQVYAWLQCIENDQVNLTHKSLSF